MNRRSFLQFVLGLPAATCLAPAAAKMVGAEYLPVLNGPPGLPGGIWFFRARKTVVLGSLIVLKEGASRILDPGDVLACVWNGERWITSSQWDFKTNTEKSDAS